MRPHSHKHTCGAKPGPFAVLRPGFTPDRCQPTALSPHPLPYAPLTLEDREP